MRHVLTLCDYYLPGYKAGGPIQSISSLIARLRGDFRFSVVTRDRDLGAAAPYPDIDPDRWQEQDGVPVLYMSPRHLGPRGLRRVFRENPHDVVYLNSFLSPPFTISTLLLRRIGLVPRVPAVLAPRGELSGGALGLSRAKKRVYLAAARLLGLYRNLDWQASNELERDAILCWLPGTDPDRVRVVSPLPSDDGSQFTRDPETVEKRSGELDLVFLSRVSPMKNLEGALGALAGLRGDVRFHIYGPREDRVYWNACEAIVQSLPGNVRVECHGPVAREDVRSTLARHHALLLPTRGENFGHVILEALLAGCPVVISDRTPWRRLADAGAGWDLALEDAPGFTNALQHLVAMDSAALRRMCRAARDRGLAYVRDESVLERNRALFRDASC
jgi:glycosyltransferase involved in cell wall biosynthesis